MINIFILSFNIEKEENCFKKYKKKLFFQKVKLLKLCSKYFLLYLICISTKLFIEI